MIENLRFHAWQVPLLLALLAAGGCNNPAPDKPREAPRVTVASPSIRNLVEEEEYNGWLEAYKTVDVRSRVRGHITKVHFKDGDIVEHGQALFDIDPAPFAAELKQAESQSRALEAQEVAAKKVAERNRMLVKSNAAAQQDLEKSEADAESFGAQIVAKQAEAERSRLNLKYCKIEAALTGKIGKAALIEGDLVNAGGTDPLLTTIVAIDPIFVSFNVDERAVQEYQQYAAKRDGDDKQKKQLREQKIQFTFGLDTEQGFPRKGEIAFAENKYTAGTGTILIRGVTRNPDDRLIVGSRVRVRVPISDKYDAAVIPDQAVLSDQDRKYLLVLGKDNIVLRRDITPGKLLDDGMRVILPARGEKIKADDPDWIKSWEKALVITIGLQRARINYPVQPLDTSGKAIEPAGKSR